MNKSIWKSPVFMDISSWVDGALCLNGRKTSVPVHADKTLRRGLLASILKDARLSPEEFRNLGLSSCKNARTP